MVSTTAPMSFEPGAPGVDGERRVEDRRRHRLVVAHRLEAAERRTGLMDGDVAAREAVPLEDVVEHERPAGVGDVGHQRSPAQIGDTRDLRLDEQMIEAVVAAGHDRWRRPSPPRPAPRTGRRRRGRSGSGPAASPARCSSEFGAGFSSTARPRFSKYPQRLRREQRQRLRAGKHHDGEMGLFAGHRCAGQRRQPAGSEPWCRPVSAASRIRPDGWPGPDRADAPACRRPTIRRAWRCAADRSRESPRSPQRSGRNRPASPS